MQPTILEELLTLSHEIGREERGLAMLGEGNTSARLGDETFLVKASGTCLATLKPEDAVECRFSALLPLLEKQGMSDKEIDDALLAARVDTSGYSADLAEGVRAGAIGIKRDDHTILATRVKIAPLLPRLTPPVAGEVASVTGTCPTLTFVVGAVTVRTSESTDFDGGECADVKTGVRLAVAGPRGADGVLVAEHVKIPPPLTVVQGIVSALGGTCPRVSFALLEPGSRAGTTVLTSEKTRFGGAGCGDLRDAAASVREVGDIAVRHGVRLALEFNSQCEQINTLERIRAQAPARAPRRGVMREWCRAQSVRREA